MADVSRDIGRHDEAIGNLKEDMHAMRVDIAEIKEILAETKGGIRMLVGVASIGGMIGAALVKAIAFVKGGS